MAHDAAQHPTWTSQPRKDSDEVEAGIVVNAAGAWADKLGQMVAGGAHQACCPSDARLLMITAATAELGPDFPMTIDIEEQFYYEARRRGAC